MRPKSWRQASMQFDHILVVSGQRAVAASLREMLRGFGPHGTVAWTSSATDALEMAAKAPRCLLFVEAGSREVDGLSLVGSLRRSAAAAKAAPVIVISDVGTVAALRDAQNAGAHEFMIRPFSAAHLLKRLDAICGDPRSWIEVATYVGPDRRRFNSAAARPSVERRSKTVGPGASADKATA